MFEWIAGLVTDGGYVGIFVLMVAENLFPPIPSELIMPLAGFVAARGELSVAGVIGAGTLGAMVGTAPWYLLGRAVGLERIKWLAARYGRWLTVTPGEVQFAADLFLRWGGLAVLVGRLIPAVRTVISAPAGVASMPLGAFILWSSIGTLLWTTILTFAGYLLEAQFERVGTLVDPVSKLVVALVVLVYVYRVVTFKRRNRAEAERRELAIGQDGVSAHATETKGMKDRL